MVTIATIAEATASGSAIKRVHCAACGSDFVYTLSREVTVYTIAPLFLSSGRLAEIRAAQKIKDHIEQGIDLVPCPGCGHFQPAMIQSAKRSETRRIIIGYVVLLALTGAAYFVVQALGGPTLWSFPVLVVITILLAISMLFVFLPDRNKDLDRNKREAASRAMLWADFQPLIDAAAAPTDSAHKSDSPRPRFDYRR